LESSSPNDFSFTPSTSNHVSLFQRPAAICWPSLSESRCLQSAESQGREQNRLPCGGSSAAARGAREPEPPARHPDTGLPRQKQEGGEFGKAGGKPSHRGREKHFGFKVNFFVKAVKDNSFFQQAHMPLKAFFFLG